MIGVAARRAAGATARPALRSMRFATDAAAAPAASMKLNFCLPHKTIYKDKDVKMVVIPGVAGEYGVVRGHLPIVAELKPGVVQITHEEGQPAEKFFVSAGFALTHANSVTDITAIEAVPVEEIDSAAVQAEYNTSKSALASASAGSRQHAEAQVAVDTCIAMGIAVGAKVA